MFYYRLGEITNLPYFCVGGASGIGKTHIFSKYDGHYFVDKGILFIEVDEKSICSLLHRKTFKSLVVHMEMTEGPRFKLQNIRAICFVGHMRVNDVCGYIFSSEPDLHLRLSKSRESRVDKGWINPYEGRSIPCFDVYKQGYDWISWITKQIKESLDDR